MWQLHFSLKANRATSVACSLWDSAACKINDCCHAISKPKERARENVDKHFKNARANKKCELLICQLMLHSESVVCPAELKSAV